MLQRDVRRSLIVQLVFFFLELHYYFLRHCCLYPVLLLLLERGFFLYVVVNLSLIGTLVRIQHLVVRFVWMVKKK